MTIRRFLGASVAVALSCAAVATALLDAPAASAAGAPCFSQLPPVPGIPPWGFHTGAPLIGDSGSYARAAGDINLATDTISGEICQVDLSRGRPERLIVLGARSPIISHTHYAVMYGVPGNLIKVSVKVLSSTDGACKVGSMGEMTMFGSYNNVRSDSIDFRFGASCRDHDHLYHGSQVNAQVPPA